MLKGRSPATTGTRHGGTIGPDHSYMKDLHFLLHVPPVPFSPDKSIKLMFHYIFHHWDAEAGGLWIELRNEAVWVIISATYYTEMNGIAGRSSRIIMENVGC
jgi:hypothetical protein